MDFRIFWPKQRQVSRKRALIPTRLDAVVQFGFMSSFKQGPNHSFFWQNHRFFELDFLKTKVRLYQLFQLWSFKQNGIKSYFMSLLTQRNFWAKFCSRFEFFFWKFPTVHTETVPTSNQITAEAPWGMLWMSKELEGTEVLEFEKFVNKYQAQYRIQKSRLQL